MPTMSMSLLTPSTESEGGSDGGLWVDFSRVWGVQEGVGKVRDGEGQEAGTDSDKRPKEEDPSEG